MSYSEIPLTSVDGVNVVVTTLVTAGEGTPAKLVVSFAADATPTLADYQTNYAATYGEHPVVQLVTIDGDGNYIQRSEQAKYTMALGLIDSISWDLADAETGFIILRT
jgi:hypothetical protein